MTLRQWISVRYFKNNPREIKMKGIVLEILTDHCKIKAVQWLL